MSTELTERAIACLAECQKIPREKINLDSSFSELGIDSMDGINIVFALENEFDISIPDEDAQNIRSVREMIGRLEKVIAASQSGAAKA